MPVINFSYSDLCDLVGREVPRQLLRDKLPLIGADMKSVPDEGDELSFEFFPDRPDMYSVEGIARAVRAFFGYEPGLRTYNVEASDVDLHVDPSVNEVRPFIWSALVEGNEMTDPLIRSMMDLQEKLHLTHGRNRRKVAIGIHDFRTVKPPFTYKAVLPDELSFVPLQGSRRMTPAEILRDHEKGVAYAFVLEGKKRYPLIVDREGEVLSFPPIINGIATAITEETRDIFVDCTGTDLNAVRGAVNILATALAERGGKIKSVRIHQDGRTVSAPELSPLKMSLDPAYANRWIGTSLAPGEMADCLRRMGFGATAAKTGLDIMVPRYRTDILHPVDLAEDVAVGHGFEKFGNSLPVRATFGVADDALEFGGHVKTIMIGLGYFEVVTLSLSNPKDQYMSMGIPEDRKALRVRNPVSTEHTLVRTSLLPSLMTVLRKNKHRELPQRIFEIGDVVIGGRNEIMLTCVSIHAKASFTEIKSLAQSVMSGLGIQCDITQHSSPSFIDGRCAAVEVRGERIGMMGEMSPSVIESFDLRYPIVALELDMDSARAILAKGADSR